METTSHHGLGLAATAAPTWREAADLGEVLLPGEAGYAGALGQLFSSEAATTRPHCIVRPRDVEEIVSAVRMARESGRAIMVRGGGHSALCAGDGAVMIDMSAHFSQVEARGETARIGGGATMGGVLAALAKQSRLVPVGVAKTPGLGLALQGGVGHLTRSLGLTLDCIREVEIVTASGDVLRLNAESTGDEAGLWWAARGCAPNFGIVTRMEFRTLTAPLRVYAERLLFPLEAVPAYFEMARDLPRSISASAVLGPTAGSDEPALFLYIVYAGHDSAGIQRVQELTRSLMRNSGAKPLLQQGGIYPYADMPPMDVPPLSGFPIVTPPEAPSANPRVFAFKKSPFLKSLDATAAARFVEAIRTAPTALCRIDLQHCGGAMSEVAPEATAFWNRDFEWNCPIIGGWTDPGKDREACTDWVRRTRQRFEDYAIGTYCVEILPGLPETPIELRAAFGGNLAKLQTLKRKWDPDRVFRNYYPIESK